jgi:flagellar export protein FliJ
MTKPFRFEPLLELVERREDEQTQVLASLSAEEHTAREQLRLLEVERERAFAQFATPSGPIDADQYRSAIAYAELLTERITTQQTAVDEAVARVTAARDSLLEVVKERRSFEHLRDQDEAAAAEIEDRREASQVDDLNMGRHNRRSA